MSEDLSSTGENLKSYQKLFTQTGGFVCEVGDINSFKSICSKYNLVAFDIGEVISDPSIKISDNGKEVVKLSLSEMQDSWLNSLARRLR